MASQVDVCNMAMTLLGEQPITSLLDNTPRARALNTIYNTERVSELTSNFWNFSVVRTQLAALTMAPLYQFQIAYQLPTGFLKIIDVGDMYPSIDMSDYIGSDDSQWAIEGQTLVCNYPAPLKLRYCQDMPDEGTWDGCFVRSMACRLAASICELITQNSTKRQMAESAYQKSLLTALRADAMQLPPKKPNDDTWMISRIQY